MLAVFQHLRAIHENMLHSDRILMRFLEYRAIADRRRIENHHIGEHSLLHETTMVQPEIRRGQAAQFPNRIRQSQHFLFPDIFPEHAREIAVGPRMAIRFEKSPFRSLRGFIRSK